jgi:hypothetical protein
VAVAVLAGALGTALIAGGLWMAFGPEPTERSQTDIEPAEPTTPETATASAGTTEAVGATQTSPASNGGSGSGTDESGDGSGLAEGLGAPKRVAKIAYRLEDGLYVSDEDGGNATLKFESARGPYALSPDAATLAVIEAGSLNLVDVATGEATVVGPAASTATPSWLADSSRVVYRRRASGTTEGFQLFYADRKGGQPELLAPGSQAAVSPDASVIVVLVSDEPVLGGAASVQVSLDGSPLTPVSVKGGVPISVATNGKRVFVGVEGSEGGSAVISMAPDGRDAKQVVGPVPNNVPATWGTLLPSPDGGLLAMAAHGDDGYSRTFIVSSSGGTPVAISRRRDSYLHSWSASGDRLFVVEGNAFQGEPTALVSVARNGTGRRVVVDGAE